MSLKLKDLIVFIPGVGGSILQKDGKDIWAPTGQVVGHYFSPFTDYNKDIKLVEDDPTKDYLDDGIRATGIVRGAQIIPGLWKIGIYEKMTEMIKKTFGVVEGHLDSDKPANYIEFPYDWRRDNRASARRLKKVVEGKLDKWRKETGFNDAKVIIIAHSMGGLVARHYLEVLEGWLDCKVLITFGTPYRGSANALKALAKGTKFARFINLTEALRSFTSTYQLLPIYKIIEVDGEYKRIEDIPDIPNLPSSLAKQGREFHLEIESAVNKHLENNYENSRYTILPFVGISQSTNQSAKLSAKGLEIYKYAPSSMSENLQGGDGIVPKVSAIPIEYSEELSDTFVSERHMFLHENEHILKDLYNRLVKTQTSEELSAIRGLKSDSEAKQQITEAAISLDIEDIYSSKEAITISAKLVDVEQGAYGKLLADIKGVGHNKLEQQLEFSLDEDSWTLKLPKLQEDIYYIRVYTSKSESAPLPINEVFISH